MSVTVNDIMQVMESIAPVHLAEDWDNVGLQIGQADGPADTVGVALDPTLDVIQNACSHKLNLLITHHPLIFRPISCIDFSSTFGTILKTALQNGLSILTAHTNYDTAVGGLNDILARRMKLKNPTPLSKSVLHSQVNLELQNAGKIQISKLSKLDPADPKPIKAQLHVPLTDTGIGRIGDISAPMRLREFALSLKTRLGLAVVRMTGDPDLMVRRVAICTGSGSSLLKDFFKSDAQVFVSGDLRYHDAKDVQALGRGMIDIGHFGSEHIMVAALSGQLVESCKRKGLKVRIVPIELETDPFLNL